MGGMIGVESEVGRGSTFAFTLPFEITDKISEEKYVQKNKRIEGSTPPDQARVLVAEDQKLNQILIKKLLERFGVGYFEVVNNGVEVLQRYKDASWDAILMDCHMPEKNGYDATIDIRTLEKETGKHVPIIAMTANAMAGDRDECFQCGMDEYTSKPINIEELKAILGQWINFRMAQKS